jgi:ppGpp synthetase/RelA/SpoT-type nucleotidyltranferase
VARPSNQKAKLAQLQNEYAIQAPLADRLLVCLRDQLGTLLEKNRITLGVPMESRVKSWASIKEKIESGRTAATTISEVSDLAGLRLILLFRTDIEKLDLLLHDNLAVTISENTAHRLGESQFGYQSNHYSIQLPSTWSDIPSYSDLGGKNAEIQVRTVAQHIWAAASHKLQYKREESVPPPLRRTIYRISALLETVDLELSRVIDERASYLTDSIDGNKENEKLNVDLLSRILTEIYPAANAGIEDQTDYDELLQEMRDLDINTRSDLVNYLKATRQKALRYDKKIVRELDIEELAPEDAERYFRGVFFTHVGLARISITEGWKDET